MRWFIFLLIYCCPYIAWGQLEEIDPNDPRLKFDFWRENYEQVKEGPEYELAQSVFRKILAVADKPVGVLPRLHVFSDLKLAQLFATRDGVIIMPLESIKFCQKYKEYTEDCLAFLIGHEVKHIVRGDYELVKTLVAFIDSVGGAMPTKDFRDLWIRAKWLPSLEQRKEMERQADEYGVLYASLAGYRTKPMTASKKNFISEYYKHANLDEYGGLINLSPEERIKAVNARIKSILEHLDLFYCGVKFYAIGEYQAAIELLTKFAEQYPSREVFNNRGLCYYQQALSFYAKWDTTALDSNPNFVFKLSPQIDPISRAKVTTRAILPKYERMFLEAINQTISDFEEAKKRDSQYPVVYNNLACAHLLKGELGHARDYFKTAIKLDRSYKEAHNNLGVCYAAEGNGEKAKEGFLDANRILPTYCDPIYNLGMLYFTVGRKEEAKEYFKRYLECDKTGGYANKAREFINQEPDTCEAPDLNEKIAGITPESLTSFDEHWREFRLSNARLYVFHDRKQHIGYCFYWLPRVNRPDKFIRMIWNEKGYKGKTTKRIRIGNSDQSVEFNYPFCREEIPSAQGVFWVYKDLGLVFEMRYGRVYGWFVFEVE